MRIGRYRCSLPDLGRQQQRSPTVSFPCHCSNTAPACLRALAVPPLAPSVDEADAGWPGLTVAQWQPQSFASVGLSRSPAVTSVANATVNEKSRQPQEQRCDTQREQLSRGRAVWNPEQMEFGIIGRVPTARHHATGSVGSRRYPPSSAAFGEVVL